MLYTQNESWVNTLYPILSIKVVYTWNKIPQYTVYPKTLAGPDFSTRLAAMLQSKLQVIVTRFNFQVAVELIPVKSVNS